MTDCKTCGGTGIIPPKVRLLCGCTETGNRLESRVVALTKDEANFVARVVNLWGLNAADGETHRQRILDKLEGA